MCSRVDQTQPADIQWAGQQIRRHVADYGYVANIRYPAELDAADRLVGGVVQVRGIVTELPLRLRRHIAERPVLGARDDVDISQPLRRVDRLLRPFAGVDVIGDSPALDEIHRNHLELQGRPALQEQHLIAVGDPEQRTQISLGCLSDRDVVLATVAHLHHRLAGAVPIEHLIGCQEKHILGEGARAGAEVEDACHELRSCLLE